MAVDLKNLDLKDLNFKGIYEWPIYGRVVVLCLVCLGVFYGGYFFDFSNIGSQILQKYKQEQDLKQQLKTIIGSEEQMKEVVAQYPAVMKLLNEWQGQLITAASLPDLLNQILKLGAANHIQFSLFAPGAKIQQDDYYQVPIKVVMQGHYAEMAHFMSEVANLPQLVAITNFQISRQDLDIKGNKNITEDVKTVKTLTAELILEVYYLVNKK